MSSEKTNELKARSKALIEDLKDRATEANTATENYNEAVRAVLDSLDENYGTAWRKPTQFIEGRTVTQFFRTDKDLFLQFASSAGCAMMSNPNFPQDTKPEVVAVRIAKIADALVGEFNSRFEKDVNPMAPAGGDTKK